MVLGIEAGVGIVVVMSHVSHTASKSSLYISWRSNTNVFIR